MTADPVPLTVRSSRARRRQMVGWLMEGLASLAALAALVVLALVLYAVIKRGFPALSKEFFTSVPSTDAYGNPAGGVANSIIGSIIIVGIATLISIPFGVLIAIYDVEFAPPAARHVIQLALNVLAGVPSVVIGVFIFGLLVVGNGYSAYAASIALSVIMVPLIARSTEEVLLLVPAHLREGGMALGATRARTVLTVILPTTFGGIVTGTVLAVARAAGETAPILFTSAIFANAISTDPSKAMGSLPMVIYTDSEQPSQFAQQQAWGAALVLVTFVLVASIVGRVFAARNRRNVGRV